jgi:hypothetical protein
MSLKNSIQNDATLVFLSQDEFAERVTYYPFSGSPREIDAVVFSQSMELMDEGNTIVPSFEVHVANGPEGISSDEINLKVDQIEFPVRDKLAASKRTIVRIQDQDEGMLVLECR